MSLKYSILLAQEFMQGAEQLPLKLRGRVSTFSETVPEPEISGAPATRAPGNDEGCSPF